MDLLSSRRRRGFTLVELLVVVAIIALLVSVLLPTLTRTKEIARRTVCATNLGAMGKAWQMYWSQYGPRTPNMFNPGPPGTPAPGGVPDVFSQFNFVIFCPSDAFVDGREEGNVWSMDYVNAGRLFKTKLIPSARTYVCPTMEGRKGGPWFDAANPWPVDRTGNGKFTQMSYGTRRMLYYDNPLEALEDYNNRPDMKTLQHMIWYKGVEGIKNVAGFSFMADQFRTRQQALLSHVPGVNVQYLDAHVSYFEDASANGGLFYNNQIDTWDYEYNWKHDDIWMIIDGYHKLPVGQ